MTIDLSEDSRIIVMLSVCNFIIGVGAFVVVGVLNPIADTFQISTSEAGFIMTAYAIAYAIGSPLCVAFSGRYSRRNVMMLGMALFGLGSLLTALAVTPAMLHGARIIAALGAGMVTPVAAAVAFAAAAPGQQGKALSRVFFGLTLAQVVGVPVGSFIGYTFGWQAAFFIVVMLCVVASAGVLRIVPVQLAFQVNTLTTLRDALLDWRSIFSVLYTSTFIATFYVLYTYFAPLLAQTMNYGRDGITLTLLVFGVGAIVGNMLGGTLTDAIGPYRTLMLGCTSAIVFMPMYSLLPVPDIVLMGFTFLMSVLGWSFMVAQQTRLVQQTPERQNVVLALNAAAIYLGVALGSALGGSILDSVGITGLGIGAGICGLVTALHLVLSERLSPTGMRKSVAVG